MLIICNNFLVEGVVVKETDISNGYISALLLVLSIDLPNIAYN